MKLEYSIAMLTNFCQDIGKDMSGKIIEGYSITNNGCNILIEYRYYTHSEKHRTASKKGHFMTDSVELTAYVYNRLLSNNF